MRYKTIMADPPWDVRAGPMPTRGKPFVVVVQVGPSREPLSNGGRAIVWPPEMLDQAMEKAASVGELDVLVPVDEWTGPTVDVRRIRRRAKPREVTYVDERMLDRTGGEIR